MTATHSICGRSTRKNTVGKMLVPPLMMITAMSAAVADPAEYFANVQAGVIYTDNLFLAPSGTEVSDMIYAISPTVGLTKTSDRLDINLQYNPQAYYYDDYSENDEIYNVFQGDLTGTVVRDALFLYVAATNFQTILSPSGDYPTSNIPVTNNRVDSLVTEVAPYWEQDLGSTQVFAEWRFFNVDFDDPMLSSTGGNQAAFELNNFARQQGFAWGVGYDFQAVTYDNAPDFKYQSAALDLGYWINGNNRVFVIGGKESPYDDILTESMEDSFWEVGFDYRPNQRLAVLLAGGERSYGSTVRADISYELVRGATSLSYIEGPATRSEVVYDRDPFNPIDDFDNVLDQPGAQDRFVWKRGEWNTTLNLSKTNIDVQFFYDERDQRTTAQGMPIDVERATGVSALLNWNVGNKTDLNFGYDFAHRDVADLKDDLSRFSIDLTYTLGLMSNIQLAVLRSERDRDVDDVADYTENMIQLTFFYGNSAPAGLTDGFFSRD